MNKYQGIELEIKDWIVIVDIYGIEDNEVDFSIIDMYENLDAAITQESDRPTVDDIREEVLDYAYEMGLL